MPARNCHTVFDALEASGYFATNPANTQSRDSEGLPLYRGPIELPTMLYHPTGATEITVPGEELVSRGGRVQWVGEQRALVNRIVQTEVELEQALAEGWHRHPAEALAEAMKEPGAELPTGVKPGRVPPMGGDLERRAAADREATLRAEAAMRDQEIARLQAELAAARGGAPGASETDPPRKPRITGG
jgi:hypothetical protein